MTAEAAICGGKHHFPSWEKAEQARRRLKKSHKNKHGRHFNVYRCPACGQGFCVGTAWSRRKKGVEE